MTPSATTGAAFVAAAKNAPPQRAIRSAALSRLASRWWALFCAVIALGGALLCNRVTALQATPSAIARTPDFAAIVSGYQQSSGPFDTRWWTGSWIHQEQGAYRPLTSVFHYAECAIGFRWGFIWVTLIGLALYVGCCVAAGALTRELFRGAPWPAIASAGLASLAPHFIPKLYANSLAWFPGHPEYLWTGALLLGCTYFVRGVRVGARWALAASVALIVIACLVKEAAYIGPLMYAVCAGFVFGEARRTGDRPLSPACVAVVVAGLLAGMVTLYAFRRAVVPNPITPKLDAHLWAKHLCWMYNAWYAFVLSEPAYCLLALSLFVSGSGAILWLGQRRRSGERSARPGVALAGLFVFVIGFGLPWGIAGLDPVVALLYLTEQPARLYEFGLLLFFLYTLYLVAAYARRMPQLLAAWLLVNLSYLPVLSFMGPHYAIAGWMFRAVYSVALGVAIADHAGLPLLSWLRRQPFLAPLQNNAKRNFQNV